MLKYDTGSSANLFRFLRRRIYFTTIPCAYELHSLVHILDVEIPHFPECHMLSLMEMTFNPCGEFRWSPEDPVSQIHSPHLYPGVPGIFSDLLRSVQMLKRERDAECKGKLQHLFIPSKTATSVPEFAVEELALGSTAECAAQGQVFYYKLKHQSSIHSLYHGCAKVAHCVPARWRNFFHYCRLLRQYHVFWAQRSTDRRADSRRCTLTSD